MEALATKYRPKEFEECIGQSSIISILKRQLELNEFKHCYLFTGASGTGKTTLARVFANKINKGLTGGLIEIDAASNNGVDNVRAIIDDAKNRAIGCEYKIYILDEAHMLTIQSWNAFLKCIEEPPKYTIFMFCTTDPQKIPVTILNRVMRFNLTKVSSTEIKSRLSMICESEHFVNYDETVDYISKICEGGVRDAINYLDKCSSYNNDLDINNVLYVLGNYSYDTMFKMTDLIVDSTLCPETRESSEKELLNIIETFYNQGNDLKMYIEQFIDFVLDLNKYSLFRSTDVIKIPNMLEEKIKYSTSFDKSSIFLHWLLDELLNIKNSIKYDSNVKNTIEIMLLHIMRSEWWNDRAR